MLLGRMNDPARPLAEEIAATRRLGFDFVDLTLEPPGALVDDLDPAVIRRQLDAEGLQVVGHTAWFLPLAHPFRNVRLAAVDQLRRDLDGLAEIGCDRVTIHPDRGFDHGFSEVERLQLQAESYAALIDHARPLQVTVMCENCPGFIGRPDLLARHLFEPLPELGLLLDVAHAGLLDGLPTVYGFLKRLGDRLRHVHVSDNDGRQDLHQPVGTMRLPLRAMLEAIRATGYDDTITLEVFCPESTYQEVSRELVRAWWNAI